MGQARGIFLFHDDPIKGPHDLFRAEETRVYGFDIIKPVPAASTVALAEVHMGTTTSRRYRNSSGQFVSRVAVRGQPPDETTIDRVGDDIRGDALALHGLRAYVAAAMASRDKEQNVKAIHVMSTAAAAGGWDRVPSSEWLEAGPGYQAATQIH